MARTEEIDWAMSAALENVRRGGEQLPEVTSLQGAVRAWLQLEDDLQAEATLTPERAVEIDGVATPSFSGQAIAALAERLPNLQSLG
ncbi:MAG: hypothetical protein M3Q08_07630 [Pseudomonadota bacterium]|nr:hypothetical protein [Pseudomonadota bacterium]